MKSRIVWGDVGHWRKSPREHSFTYPVFTFAFDVDELSTLAIAPRLVAFEKRAIFSVRSADYLEGEGSLREKVERLLKAHGYDEKPARITLITSPRYFGYVFNPVSFFACFDANENVLGLITQVNNTFGDTHVYPLVCAPSSKPVVWRFSKDFFVSPFFNMEGTYEVALESEGDHLSIRVDLHREGEKIFAATLRGEGASLSRRQVFATLRKFPITSLLTMPRIHGQAMQLYFKAHAGVYTRPEPHSSYTIRSKQNIIHRARLALLSLLQKARGTLQ
ncbi:MAG: hypothetical protein RL518_2744 [Pseudomonadota bacterium]|jgi:cyclopropane-fatty-acyl-phospholipid synthase